MFVDLLCGLESLPCEGEVRRGLLRILDKILKKAKDNENDYHIMIIDKILFILINTCIMSKLREILEHALLMENQPGTQADEVISYIREQFENIENPHRALELELAQLVEAKRPPDDEFYKTRNDRKELAVAFFIVSTADFMRLGCCI